MRRSLAELVDKLMAIRKDWTIQDYKEAYDDGEWDVIPDTVPECLEKMEEHIYWRYDMDYIQECIENEKQLLIFK